MLLREAVVEDVPKLTDLLGQLGYSMDPAAVLANLNAYVQSSDRAVWVVEKDGSVVALLALDIAPTFHRRANQMRIVSFVVDKHHRGQGIGKFLLETAEKVALEKGCWIIELSPAMHRKKDGTHAFYENFGYVLDPDELYYSKKLSRF